MPIFPGFGGSGFGDAHEAGVVLNAWPVEEGAPSDGQVGVVVLVGVDKGSENGNFSVIA